MRWLYFPASGTVLSWLSNMDYAYRGAPFVAGAPLTTINLESMDYAYRGSPFIIYARQS